MLFNSLIPTDEPIITSQDSKQNKLTLSSLIIKNPESTFFMRVRGDYMINVGIYDNDIIVVDKSIVATNKKIIVAVLDGSLTIRKLCKNEKQANSSESNSLGILFFLVPENSKYKPIPITAEQDFSIWGVVTYVIHSLS